jgi:chromosome segregation ATPase
VAYDRSAWTDERLDHLAATLDTRLATLDTRFDQLHDEIRELRNDIRAQREEFSAWQRQNAQIGWALAGTLTAALVAVIISLA